MLIDCKSDEELAMLSKNGDRKAESILFDRYRSFVKIKARSYFLVGADREDIIQEGMIGLFKGIRDYNPDKSTSFKAFAELCVQRQIITAVKTATRQKHNPLNTYISLDMPMYDEESDKTLIDLIASTKISEPEAILIGQEDLGKMQKKIYEVLSELEWKVLMSYISGKTYYEIAKDLNKQVKSIDNALQRVKRKLENYLQLNINANIET
ncbi:RNA polymerase sporulation sigma factor SigH [Alkalibaculum sp. M08DMB]|uniref:RNA polymerase sigma factor SigS n=1 Tax=Alkalibaculum sporogenes TaxID=2655001 RepID=A0A6A7K6M3_9FIRM|nr:RNA polymerase sporulation sigma factor SigH [Alkalibaculum sporogenes]MPW25044.1 RNA polymerase sporulation sigma factor SigH [Alkalibaculum sporogenes]